MVKGHPARSVDNTTAHGRAMDAAASTSSGQGTSPNQTLTTAPPFWRSIVAVSSKKSTTGGSFTIKIFEALMTHTGRSVEFQPKANMHITLCDTTANVDYISSIIERKCGGTICGGDK